MIEPNCRQSTIHLLDTVNQWDLIVVGGGVLGAGICKYATQLGLKVLLLEQKDFAWGSSSRSSKMVHGGLRYIAQGDIKLTRESVEERQLLLEKANGLVGAANYVMSHRRGKFPGKHIFALLMYLYGFFAGGKQHRSLSAKDYQQLMPGIDSEGLEGGTAYVDALTDDARLVCRLILEARGQGAVALNYAKVVGLLRSSMPQQGSKVTGVRVRLEEYEQDIELNGKLVVNATGAWSHQLDNQVHIRPLRGSHILVPSWRLPVASVLTMLHPKDQRPVMIYPWQNTTLIGTTDLDHTASLSIEPKMLKDELDYLLMAVEAEFPGANLTKQDIISSYAGVRPIVLDKPLDSTVAGSKEKRVHSLFSQPGALTVCGGKLTTFRLIAIEVLQQAAAMLGLPKPTEDFVIFDPSTKPQHPLSPLFGPFTTGFIKELGLTSGSPLMQPIGYSKTYWAELIFALKYEQVCHLDDLMLRRTRLGNVLPQGGKAQLQQIREVCEPYLDWTPKRWSQEVERYLDIWQNYYSVPE